MRSGRRYSSQRVRFGSVQMFSPEAATLPVPISDCTLGWALPPGWIEWKFCGQMERRRKSRFLRLTGSSLSSKAKESSSREEETGRTAEAYSHGTADVLRAHCCLVAGGAEDSSNILRTQF